MTGTSYRSIIGGYDPGIDEELAKVEAVLVESAAALPAMAEVDLIRWRWDVASVEMTWNRSGKPMGRNLVVARTHSGRFIVETNAWVDFFDETGKPKRRGQHFPDPAEYELIELPPAMARAIKQVFARTKDELTHVSDRSVMPE